MSEYFPSNSQPMPEDYGVNHDQLARFRALTEAWHSAAYGSVDDAAAIQIEGEMEQMLRDNPDLADSDSVR